MIVDRRSVGFGYDLRIPATVSAIAFVVAVFMPETSSLLQYRHDFDLSGEVWRLVTAHFVHLDWPHFLFNLVGLWLLWLLVGNAFTLDQWLLLIVLLSVSITIALKIGSPEIAWYVGLSGLLYGMLTIGLVVKIDSPKSPPALLFTLVLLKVLFDSFSGPLTLMDLASHRVVAEAHAYGMASGVSFGLLWQSFIVLSGDEHY